MKSINEIEKMLVAEITNSLESIDSVPENINYYNEVLGDVSFLLASLLESKLKIKGDGWSPKKWIDDSLITDVKIKKNEISIWGVIIWGKLNITKQWTEPLFFTIELANDKTDFKEYSIFFGDSEKPEILYEDFVKRRDYWDTSKKDRKWKYIFNSKDV